MAKKACPDGHELVQVSQAIEAGNSRQLPMQIELLIQISLQGFLSGALPYFKHAFQGTVLLSASKYCQCLEVALCSVTPSGPGLLALSRPTSRSSFNLS